MSQWVTSLLVTGSPFIGDFCIDVIQPEVYSFPFIQISGRFRRKQHEDQGERPHQVQDPTVLISREQGWKVFALAPKDIFTRGILYFCKLDYHLFQGQIALFVIFHI